MAKVSTAVTDAGIRVRGGRSFYFFGALGAVLYGYDTGVIGGAMLFLSDQLRLSSFQQGLVTSCILIGAMVGTIVGGSLADRLGRRAVVFTCSVIFVVGSLAAAVAPTVTVLIVSRLVLGLAVGGASVVVPLYLAEMAPTRIRGAIATLNQTLIILGVGLAALVDYLVRDAKAWRLAFGIGVVPALIMLVGVLFMPETPRWLIRRGREQAARVVLGITRRPETIDAEVTEIRQVEAESKHESGLRAILSTRWIRATVIVGVCLAAGQQITGINTIVYYTPSILTSLGVSTTFALLFGVINTVPNLVAVGIAARLVDRAGRKPLLSYGALALTVGMLALGLPHLFHASPSVVDAGAIAGLVIFTVSFSLTWGPVLWVVLSEIFPLNVRGTAMSLATISNWIFNFLVSFTLPIIITAWGTGAVFLMYGLLGIVVFGYVQRFVRETKGRSLEQIEIDQRQGGAAAPRAREGDNR